ncbi:MAG: radical SAM protein [Terriglobia bacterium]
MTPTDVFRVWSSILHGRRPFLSIEITRECPLRCPGCYAYAPEHLGSAGSLRQLTDLRDEALVAGVLRLIHQFRPLHLSIVGGEPLVRHRELSIILPKLADLGVEVQLVTSAVRPIPAAWKNLPNLRLVVSIDGLQPEHDKRRSPATYERILKHIAGHRMNVHCTLTREHLQRRGYLKDFASFWSEREEVKRIWFSLFTPQEGDHSQERLTPQDRQTALDDLGHLRESFPKLEMPDLVLDGYLHPPSSPQECMFAKTTTTISSDLATRIVPCQFGGQPVCSECGCMASAGLTSIGKYKLLGLVKVSHIFSMSEKAGDLFSAAAQRI